MLCDEHSRLNEPTERRLLVEGAEEEEESNQADLLMVW